MLKGKHGKNRILKTLFLVFFVGLLLGKTVYAIEPMEVGRNVTLTVNYLYKDVPVPDVEFCIYKVAESSEFAEFAPVKPFEEYPVEIEGANASEWKELAETLAAYVEWDSLKPYDSGKTGKNGKLKFPTKSSIKMTTGLYLVVGEMHKEGNNTYTSEAFLVSLPNLQENEKWNYDVISTPKTSKMQNLSQIKVLKIWADSQDKSKRPEKIEVELLCDGKVYDVVMMSKKNNWRHTWKGLEEGHDWKVVEKKVPSAYTVILEKDGSTFTLTNKLKLNPKPPKDSTLPQTGVLWWPIPVLACSGMLLFVWGWTRRRKQEVDTW